MARGKYQRTRATGPLGISVHFIGIPGDPRVGVHVHSMTVADGGTSPRVRVPML